MKPSVLMTVLEKTIRAKQPVLLVGPPGSAKTDMVHQVAARVEHDLIVIHPVTGDPTDMKGLPWINPTDGLADFIPFGDLRKMLEATEPTVVLVDDFGHAFPQMQASFMHLFLARHIGEHKLSDNVTFIVCTNDTTHHAGVTGILEPIKSRMMSIINVETDVEDWVAWAIENNIAPEVVSFMRFIGHKLLSDFQPTTGLTNSPSPRGQVQVSNIIKMNFAPDVEKELIAGCCGQSYAEQIFNYLQIYRNLPDPMEILRNPGTCEVPTDNMLLFAYCGALGSMARPDIMDKIVTFGKRLPIEFAVKLLMLDCKAADPGNHEVTAYTNWAIENARHMTAA